MRLAHDVRSTLILAILSAACVIVSASPVRSQPGMFDSSVVAKETSNGSSINQDPSTHALLTHWMVLVKIRPRPGDNGNARIILMDGSGTTITTFTGIALPYSGLAVGVKGPRRDIHNGDTPFGVYKFVETAGGTPQDRLPPGFGTGKVYLHDKDLYGEVADAQRSLIRLHGGGSALAEPYALNQPLLPTKGCVRMKNADVNDLIQRLKQLTPDNSVQFIFMGDDAYLTRLATDTTLNTKPWWSALRTALHIPATPIVSGISITSGVTSSASMSVASEPQSLTTGENVAPQTPESLIELVNVFAEDVGPKGQEALNALRSRTAELVSLQTSLPADDALRPKLAFVLCNLDHDAEANRSVLQSALTDPSQYKSVFADQVQDMISRLIDREDELGNEQASTSLTRSLIASAPQADGALSEGLGITLSKQLRVRSGVFLSAWGEHFSAMAPEESKGLKTKVYALMKASHRLTPGEIANIRTYLYSLRDFSEEFGDAVKDFSQMYFHPTGNKRQRQRQFRR